MNAEQHAANPQRGPGKAKLPDLPLPGGRKQPSAADARVDGGHGVRSQSPVVQGFSTVGRLDRPRTGHVAGITINE